MKSEELRDFHTEFWERLRGTLPNELTAPYLEIDDPRPAYAKMEDSLGGVGNVDDYTIDAPVPEAMTINYDSKGKWVFAYGGILVPTKCLEDSDDQTKAGLVHEQVHDVLRNRAFIYGLINLFRKNAQSSLSI